MYYKIINKESEIYQKLYELRSKELKIQSENKELVMAKVGEYKKVWGFTGQQHHGRVTKYIGFVFNPEKVNYHTWKEIDEEKNLFVPNKRTKSGREMAKFLDGLEESSFLEIFEIFGFPLEGEFVLPYLEIIGDMIILFLDKSQEPNDDNVIEITKKEFYQLLDNENDS